MACCRHERAFHQYYCQDSAGILPKSPPAWIAQQNAAMDSIRKCESESDMSTQVLSGMEDELKSVLSGMEDELKSCNKIHALGGKSCGVKKDRPAYDPLFSTSPNIPPAKLESDALFSPSVLGEFPCATVEGSGQTKHEDSPRNSPRGSPRHQIRKYANMNSPHGRYRTNVWRNTACNSERHSWRDDCDSSRAMRKDRENNIQPVNIVDEGTKTAFDDNVDGAVSPSTDKK